MTGMPRPVDDLQADDPLPVKPETNEFEALDFLVGNRGYGFTPSEVAERTSVRETSATKTMARLYDKGLVERTDGAYFVDPERAKDLQRRLESIDNAVRLHDTDPDDAADVPGWEDVGPTLSPAPDVSSGGVPSTEPNSFPEVPPFPEPTASAESDVSHDLPSAETEDEPLTPEKAAALVHRLASDSSDE